jgi:hypothetical protein
MCGVIQILGTLASVFVFYVSFGVSNCVFMVAGALVRYV